MLTRFCLNFLGYRGVINSSKKKIGRTRLLCRIALSRYGDFVQKMWEGIISQTYLRKQRRFPYLAAVIDLDSNRLRSVVSRGTRELTNPPYYNSAYDCTTDEMAWREQVEEVRERKAERGQEKKVG